VALVWLLQLLALPSLVLLVGEVQSVVLMQRQLVLPILVTAVKVVAVELVLVVPTLVELVVLVLLYFDTLLPQLLQ
jgi:hypothetical protein